MKNIEAFDWNAITEALHSKGYGLIEQVLEPAECQALIASYNESAHYRKTITMERYRFGLGEYKYFAYPLPDIIQSLRERFYPKLAPIAHHWMQALNIGQHYPAEFSDFQAHCHDNQQTKPTVLILKYGEGGHNTLHQDLYGDIFFPIQLVIFLSEPGEDYEGGEFVLTQQMPRAQSRAIVLKPKKGDVLLFTTNFRPIIGTKGYYRANMKHGVSEVKSGNRYTLGIIFHDALS
ncbi:2OG-Fe(II) oxygenase [Dyadobacter sp. CY326]|uniref:2OG-Fe(II) oxygenase n=1 Tax=Dyadobacter sp. CY326 TaxID=2907300 RepID=UPI001F3E3E77|nr:2OG-Fe(II) oxygenase [Dyadobacter sp. CY326]MCE7064746.1 2OG-Fe(II) oxygenase [Dyadobacter sp. CY326]